MVTISFPCNIGKLIEVGEKRRKHIESCPECQKLKRDIEGLLEKTKRGMIDDENNIRRWNY